MSKKVLVTGGAGFVGRHCTAGLLARGDDVTVVDSLTPRTGAVDPAAGWPLFDPRDCAAFHFVHDDCRTWFAHHPTEYFDEVYHLAAMVGGRLMIEFDPLAVAEDLAIDAMYWRWAQSAKPAKTVFFSSSAAYPVSLQRKDDYVLLRESMIDFSESIGVPDLTYGWAKLTGEYLSRLAFERHGLRSVVYRPFSGYGEDQDLTYPFPSIVKRVQEQRGAPEIIVWGSGEQMRDFIHIDDCVRGVLETMHCIDNGDAINLSTGVFTSFKQLTAQIADQCGFAPRVIGQSDKPEGVFARGGDTTKQRSLGFTPTIALTDGIARAIKYFSNFSR